MEDEAIPRVSRGDQVPQFVVSTLDGDLVRYSTIWHRKNLILVTLADQASDNGYPATLFATLISDVPSSMTCAVDGHRGVSRTPGARLRSHRRRAVQPLMTSIRVAGSGC